MVGDGASSPKIYYVSEFQGVLNLKRYQNCIIGSKITGILLNEWVLPIGVVASVGVSAQPAKQTFF